MVTYRRTFAATMIALLSLTCCKLQDEGYVFLEDKSYRATVICTNNNGVLGPSGMLADKGNLYIADQGQAAIELWSEGELKTLCDSKIGILSPRNLVLDVSGSLYFTDSGAGGLWQIEPDGGGHLVAGKGTGLLSTYGIALSPEGNILVGDGERHEILTVTRKGDISVFLGTEYGIIRPESLAFDDMHNLYILDSKEGVVYLLDSKRELHRVMDGRSLAMPPEAIFYYQGNLYLTSGRDGKLFRYNTRQGLETIAVFGGKLRNLRGLTADAGGDIFISVQSDPNKGIGYIIELSKERPD